MQYDPGCDLLQCKSGINDSFVNLIHIEASGPNDSLHYIISNVGTPTILAAKFNVPKLKNLIIDWERLLSDDSKKMRNSIRFDPKPTYTSAVVFSSVSNHHMHSIVGYRFENVKTCFRVRNSTARHKNL